MSAAAYRIRKRVKALHDKYRVTVNVDNNGVMQIHDLDHNPYSLVLAIIDAELEAEAEKQFTRPIGKALDELVSFDGSD